MSVQAGGPGGLVLRGLGERRGLEDGVPDVLSSAGKVITTRGVLLIEPPM